MEIFGAIILGLFAGGASGLFGIGGGLVMIPALVFFFQLTQHQAQGTSLAVLTLPVVFLGALKYYNEGNVQLKLAAFIAVSFVIGAYGGSILVHKISSPMLKKMFGGLLFVVSIRMILGK